MAITAVQNIIFDADCESANFDKLVLTDQSDYAGEGIDPDDVVGTWTVTFPDGDSSIVVIDPNVSVNGTTPIPLDSNGNYLEGTYTFFYSIVVSGAVQPGTYTQTIVYEFCPQLTLTPGSCTVPCIDITSNCFCLKITAVDETLYGTPTNITRDMTLYPPASLGAPSVSTNSTTLVYTFSYTGAYEVQVNTSIGYLNSTNNVGIAARVKGSVVKVVECDRNLCALYNCIKKFYASLESLAGVRGGFSSLPRQQQDQWLSVLSLSERFDNALKCGQYQDADRFYDEIKAIVDCDCGCQEGSGPQLVNPYCGNAPGTNDTVIVDGTGNIDVTSVTVGTTTTYTVAMSSGFTALISTIQSDITTLQGDVVTLDNAINALPPKQYYLLHNDLAVSDTGANTAFTALKTYTLPADTLEEGDILRITANYTLAVNDNDKTMQLNYGVNGSQLFLAFTNANPGSAQRLITFVTEVHKNSSTNVLQIQKIENGTSLPVTFPFSRRLYTADANIGASVNIVANAQNSVASAADISCISLTVELIKAP